MQIKPINTFSYQTKGKKAQTHCPQKTLQKNSPSSNTAYKPIFYRPLSISFGYGFGQIRKINGLTCACCGRKMISTKTYNSIKWPENPIETIAIDAIEKIKLKEKLSKNDKKNLELLIKLNQRYPDETLKRLTKHNHLVITPLIKDLLYENITPFEQSKKIFRILNRYKDDMHPIEKQFTEMTYNLWEKNPEKTLSELTKMLRPQHVKSLAIEQKNLLKEILKLSKNLDSDSKNKLKELVYDSKRLIIDDNLEVPFKRKTFLHDLHMVADTINDVTAKKLRKLGSNMPSSYTDLSSFIVKYSGLAPRMIEGEKAYFVRDAKEIGKRLLSTIVGTVEHIRPRHPMQGGRSGESTPMNYLYECSKCNNDRANIPLNKWIKDNPSMAFNVQKYMDEVVSLINEGRITGFNWYPMTVKQTLKKESKGLVNLDISKLEKEPTRQELDKAIRKYKKAANQ